MIPFFEKNIRLQRKDKILRELVALRMREIRERHGHTQEFLIENTRLHISHYENQQKFPSLETLTLFCKYYNLTLDEFFAPIEYPPKK